MGRQRNEQTIADIRRAIWGLFVEQHSTSITVTLNIGRSGRRKMASAL